MVEVEVVVNGDGGGGGGWKKLRLQFSIQGLRGRLEEGSVGLSRQ